ncbi:MAG: DUF2283 domain-containing protein [Solirubrobacterales bacterium]
MSIVRVGKLRFDSTGYDVRGDVLYLSVGPPRPAMQSVPTPEGHVVRYDTDGRVIGLTLISPRAKIERARGVPVTIGKERLVAETEGVEAAMATGTRRSG